MMRTIKLYEYELNREDLRGDVCGRCAMNMLSASALVIIRVEPAYPDGPSPEPRSRWEIPPGADSVVTLALLFDRLGLDYGPDRVWIQMNHQKIDNPYAVTTIEGWRVCASHIYDMIESWRMSPRVAPRYLPGVGSIPYQ